MRYVCFIEARMRSTRLPGKVMMPILGRPMLQHMVERLSRARTIDGIVIATTDHEADEPIAQLAADLEIGCFRGSEEDVLARVLGAARAYSADVIVETTGDCPLHDPFVVDKVVADFRMGGADFVSNIMPFTTPRGTDVRVFRTDDLEEVNRISDDPADHEHVSLHFMEHPEKYRLRNVTTDLDPAVTELRLTVDTPEDFQLVRQIYERLYPKDRSFSLGDVLELLRDEPDLARVNADISQKPVR